MTQMEMPLQSDPRAALIERAARKGFRPATPDEAKYGDPRDLYRASRKGVIVGPVFVRLSEGGTDL